MQFMKFVPSLLLTMGISCTAAFAATPPPPTAPAPSPSPSLSPTHTSELPYHRTYNHFELIGAGGPAAYDAGSSDLGVTSSETDRLVPTNNNTFNALALQAGVGYLYWFGHSKQYSKSFQWFTNMEPQVNVYYLNNFWGLEGNVYRFNDTSERDLTYRMLVQNIRLMFDESLTVAQWRLMSIYGIIGIGVGWNGINYRDYDKANSDCADETFNLKAKWKTNFVWEVGGGLSMALNDRASFFGEYLYTWLGKAETSSKGISSPAQFTLNVQQILFGLHLSI